MDRILFTQALAIPPHMFSGGLFGMVFEHLLGCFISKDPSSRFSKLFHVTIIVVDRDIPRLVALVLVANKLLAMTKDIGGFHPITIDEVFLRLINRSVVL
jgi:hypothetical protein